MSALTHRQFREMGYTYVLPIVPPGAPISPRSTLFKDLSKVGKVPGFRNREGKWHSFDWMNDPPACDGTLDWWTEIGAGIGIKLGPQPDGDTLVAADADTMNVIKARLIAAAVHEHVAPLIPTRIGVEPRALYLMRVSGPFPYARIEFVSDGQEERFEMLSAGKQFVAQGIHPRTNQPYRWTSPLVPYASLRRVPPETLRALLEGLRGPLDARPIKTESAKDAPVQESLRGRIEHVRAAVAGLKNTDNRYPTRESFNAIGYAIKAALPDDPEEALSLFQDWALRWDGNGTDKVNDPEQVQAEWARMKPPFRRGASWLYEQAEEHGDGSFTRAHVHFEEPPPATSDLFPPEAANTNSRAADAARFVFESFDGAAARALSDPAPYLIKGLLDLGAMSVVYGDSNAGKTFVVMDLEHHVATGRPYAGKRTLRGHVLHIFSEGARGGRKRAEALRRAYGAAPNFHLLFSSVDLFDPLADLNPLLDAIGQLGFRLSLIVIDTLARAMAGGDENNTKDMSTFVRNVDRLRITTGAHVMLIHHTGKDAARGARGSSALRAATDTEIEITPERITVTKQRDLDKSWSSGFALKVVELGRDSEGDPVTSCIVRLTGADDVMGETADAAEAREVSGLVDLLKAMQREPKASQRRLAEAIGRPKTTVARLLERLKKERLVVRVLDRWSVTPKGVEALKEAA